MIKEAIVKIVSKEDLTYDEAYAVMNEIMSGETTATQNAAFLAALSTKSTKAETIDEIAGCAAAMRDHATKVDTGMDIVEIVGTGGDGAQSFNISTTAALVAAAGGVKVAKHGNRAASSRSGTADCLEALGVNLDQSPARCVELLKEAGMCFFFAQKYHTSMKYVGAIRKELGIRTVFNILGPLTNPANLAHVAIGCANRKVSPIMAAVYASRGQSGLVYTSHEGMDELAPTGPVSVWEIRDGKVTESEFDPTVDLGLAKITVDQLKGGVPDVNANAFKDFLAGKDITSRTTALLNAASAIVADGNLVGNGTLAERFAEAYKLAEDAVDSGKAEALFDKWIETAKSKA